MLIALLVLVGIVAGVCLIASSIAAVSRFLTGSNAVSLALGTLTIPALIVASLAYWILTMEADDAPPGMVIMGNLMALAAITPISLLASHFTIKFFSRRALRNGS